MSKLRTLLPWFAVLAAIAAAGFLTAQLVTRPGKHRTEAQQEGTAAAIAQAQTAEAQEPRFVGELLGISLAPTLDMMPPAVVAEQKRIVAGGCSAIALEQAKGLQFARSLNMPTGYVLEPGYPQATACSGVPSGIEWVYSGSGAGGAPARVSVGRDVARLATPGGETGVARSRVSTSVISGRDAIVVRPATTDGLAQISAVIFPESFGKTSVDAFNLSEADLLTIARAVADAAR